MKVAIPSTGDDLSAAVDPRFGRCKKFLIVDSETMEFRVLNNTAADSAGGAGIAAAQLVVDAGAEAVVAGEVGPNASQVLEAADVRIVRGVQGTVRDAVTAVAAGQASGGPTEPRGKTLGGGGGMGGGRGRGGGGAGGGRGRGGGMGGGRGQGQGRGRGRRGGQGGGV